VPELDAGVIDVKNHDAAPPPTWWQNTSGPALEVTPARAVPVLSDCGCFHPPADVAFAKLKAMVEGARMVRKELGKYVSQHRIQSGRHWLRGSSSTSSRL
jgi:5-methyltetrahydropteroyltriglutamate--homocysteine methyltransferase